MASTQLPKVAKPAMMAASTPKVGSEAITCSLPPTSTPNKKSKTHTSAVSTCCSHAIGQRRNRRPATIPININAITMNMILS